MLKGLLRFLCRREPKKDYSFDNVSSVLIRPFTNIGDGVVITAAFARIKKVYPNIKLGVIVTKYNRSLFAKCPLVDVLVEYGFRSALANRGKWQIYYDYPEFSSKGILFQMIIAADFVIRMNKGNKKYYNIDNVRNYDFYCPYTKGSLLQDGVCFTPLLEKSGQGIGGYKYVLRAPAASENPYMNIRTGKPIVLLCVEGSARSIPLDVLAKAMEAFAVLHLKWVLLNTPNAPMYYEKLKEIDGLDIMLAPKTDFDGFYAHVYYADLVFTVDTSTVHIASAFEKPLIALYANDQGAINNIGPGRYTGSVLIYPEDVSGVNDLSKFSCGLIVSKGFKALEEFVNMS